MKIVVLDGRPLAEDRSAWTGLDKLGGVEFHLYSSADDVANRARGAGVLVTNSAPISGQADRRATRSTIHHHDGDRDLTASTWRRRGGEGIPGVERAGVRHAARWPSSYSRCSWKLCQHVAKHAEAVNAGEWTSQPDFSLRKTSLIETGREDDAGSSDSRSEKPARERVGPGIRYVDPRLRPVSPNVPGGSGQ